MRIYQDGKAFYYFIDKARWNAVDSVSFELTLDTVNTFAGDFTFNKKTRITRQHKDRLESRLNYAKETFTTSLPGEGQYLLNPYFTSQSTDGKLTGMSGMSLVVYRANGSIQSRENNVVEIKMNVEPTSPSSLKTLKVVTMPAAGFPQSHYYTGTTLREAFDAGAYIVIEWDGSYPEDLEYADNWQNMFSGVVTHSMWRKIDERTEGIEPPLFKTAESTIPDYDGKTDKWALVYKTDENVATTVDCQMWPFDAQTVDVGSTLTLSITDFEVGQYYFLMPWSVEVDKLDQPTEYYDYPFGTYWWSPFDLYVWHSGSGSELAEINRYKTAVNIFGDEVFKAPTYAIIHRDTTTHATIEQMGPQVGLTNLYMGTDKTIEMGENDVIRFSITTPGVEIKWAKTPTRETDFPTIQNKTWAETGHWIAASTQQPLNSFSMVDRTDPKLIKIVELPYSLIEDGKVPSDWTYTSGHLSLSNKNAELKKSWELTNTLDPKSNLSFEWQEPTASDLRDDANESKLWHSEFYQPKFVYDSFNYPFYLENIELSDQLFTQPFRMNYQVSNTISGRFMFSFDIPLKKSTSDYDNICLVSRNNELPIYNNEYLNYIKTGYNYDVKNKNLALAKGITNIGMGIAGTVVGAVTGNPLVLAGGAVSAAANISNLIFGQVQADQAIQRKLDETRNQATSVAGGDDVDLLDTYTGGNKAKFCVYQCSSQVRQSIADLFYYCGYKDDTQEIPVLDSRCWFNYIECDPVFNEANSTVYDEYLEDLRERYRSGVTVYHRRSGEYDWDQIKENWETSLL